MYDHVDPETVIDLPRDDQEFPIFFKTEIGKVRVGSGKHSLYEAGLLTVAQHAEEGVYELPFTPHDFGTTEVTVKFLG